MKSLVAAKPVGFGLFEWNDELNFAVMRSLWSILGRLNLYFYCCTDLEELIYREDGLVKVVFPLPDSGMVKEDEFSSMMRVNLVKGMGGICRLLKERGFSVCSCFQAKRSAKAMRSSVLSALDASTLTLQVNADWGPGNPGSPWEDVFQRTCLETYLDVMAAEMVFLGGTWIVADDIGVQVGGRRLVNHVQTWCDNHGVTLILV